MFILDYTYRYNIIAIVFDGAQHMMKKNETL